MFYYFQYFVCKTCFLVYLLEEEVRNHVQDVHNNNDDVQRDVDYSKDENINSEDEYKYKQYLAKVRRYESIQAAKNANPKCKILPNVVYRYLNQFCFS